MRRKIQPVGYFKAIAEIARIFAPERFLKICKEAASSLTAARGEPDSSAGRLAQTTIDRRNENVTLRRF
jgi:hypothetical protein